jgi:surface protein
MFGTFRNATSFNSLVANWNVSLVTDFYYTFVEATSFKTDLRVWDVVSAILMQ